MDFDNTYSLLKMTTAYAAADALVVASALLVYAANKQSLHLAFSTLLTQGMTLLLALMTFHCSTGTAGVLAAIAATTSPLALQSSRGHILVQLRGLLGIYRAFFDTETSTWPRVAIALLHTYLLLSNLSPEDGKTVRVYLGKLFYMTEWQLIRTNQIRKIKLEDIQLLPERFHLHKTYNELEYNVNEPLFLMRAIFRMVWRPVLPLLILRAVLSSVDTLMVIMEGLILCCLDSPGEHPWYQGYVAASGYVVVVAIHSQWKRVDEHIGAEIARVIRAVEMEIFRQPLVANTTQAKRRRTLPGYFMSQFHLDFTIIQSAVYYAIRTVAIFWPVYYIVGRLAFIPVAISAASVIASEVLRMLVGGQWRWESDPYSHDSKVDEVYRSIRPIKFFGWEKMFLDKDIQKHDADKDKLPWYAPIVWYTWEMLKLGEVIAAHMSTYIVMQAFIVNQSAFTTSAVLSKVEMFQLSSHVEHLTFEVSQLVFCVSKLRMAITETMRLEAILRGEPIDILPQSKCTDGNSGPSVALDKCEFRWDKCDQAPVLTDISLRIAAGELVAVVGKTGSGKSSLLLSICGEVEKTKGTGGVVGTIGYLEQSPWIMNASFRDNVVFGREYEKGLFDKVVYSCALTEDIAQWPERDLTIIGDRGVNISGGQRARLALARALYSQADIYVLDDPLSAVDAHVKRHLLEHVILDTGMLAGKLRIVSTHVKNFLPYAHQVIELSDGKATVTQQKPRIYNLDLLHKPVNDDSSPCNLGSLSEDPCTDASGDDVGTDSTAAPEASNTLADKEENDDDSSGDKKGLQKHGAWENIVYVFQICGLPVMAAITFVSVIEPVISFILDGYEISALQANNANLTNDALLYYLQLRIINLATSQIMDTVRTIIQQHISTGHLNQRIKRKFIHSLIHAPMSFFDSTIRQQVSSAYNNGARAVANNVPEVMMTDIAGVINMVLSAWHVGRNAPLLLLTVPPIVFAVNKLGGLVSSARCALNELLHVTKVEGNRTNDMIADGQQMIRLFGVEFHFVNLYMQDKDREHCLQMPIESLDSVEMTTYSILRSCGRTVVTWTMLVQSQLMDNAPTSERFIAYQRLLGTLVDYTTSTANLPSRIREFSDNIDQFRRFVAIPAEAPYIIEECRPPPNWPEQGHIEFRNFSMKYHEDLDAVLKEINLDVRPGEKIGIVGRTGSGKSSLIKSLFRLAGPHTTGNILIDGQDISAMGVGDLRPRLGTVPQEANMFEGSFKRNLDPLYEYSIEDIWAALIKCNIAKNISSGCSKGSSEEDEEYYDYNEDYREYIEDKEEAAHRWTQAGWAMRLFLLVFTESPERPKKPDMHRYGLNRKINGINGFSNGEQQLFSLCRLLMRKRRIIALDEATANVDLETDRKTQCLIRDEFSDCTILTIAHRLETIMNSDRIVVLDKGRIVEVGPPQCLVESGGHFAHLVKTNEF